MGGKGGGPSNRHSRVSGNPAAAVRQRADFSIPFGIPAYAGMTVKTVGMTVGAAGMTVAVCYEIARPPHHPPINSAAHNSP